MIGTVIAIGRILSPLGLKKVILSAPIPHSGQLNIEISNLFTPARSPAIPNKLICTDDPVVYSVSSWLAHVFPSSPVSAGMFPSNKTLEVGCLHVNCVILPPIISLSSTSVQCPTGDDPFTSDP